MSDNESYVNREGIIEQLNILRTGRINGKHELDKRLFYVITSFFPISLALLNIWSIFIDQNFFIIALVFNIGALITHIVGYYCADKSLEFKERMLLDEKFTNREIFEHLLGTKKSKWAWTEIIFGILTFGFFILAIIFLLLSLYKNII